MKKSYVVIGMGRFGTSVAERLYELGNEVLAIDTNPDKVQRMESKVTCAVVADVRDEEVLRSLGARSCDCAVVAIGSDLATCIIATLNLKDLGVPQVICKATDELRKKALEKVGADRVVIPERETGIKLRRQSRLRAFWILSSCRRTAVLPKSRRRKAGPERRCANSTSAQNTVSISLPSGTTGKLTFPRARILL